VTHDIALGEDAGDASDGIEDDDGADFPAVEHSDGLGDPSIGLDSMDSRAFGFEDMIYVHFSFPPAKLSNEFMRRLVSVHP
jgi:hypothetical protein